MFFFNFSEKMFCVVLIDEKYREPILDDVRGSTRLGLFVVLAIKRGQLSSVSVSLHPSQPPSRGWMVPSEFCAVVRFSLAQI